MKSCAGAWKRILFAVVAALPACVGLKGRATPVYEVLLKAGDVAPCSQAATFQSFSQPVINDAGQALFQAQLPLGGAIGTTNDQGVWLWTEGTCECVAREGDPVPGIANATYGSLSFSNLRLDEAGFVTLVVTLAGPDINSSNDTCFVWGKPSAMQVVAREDDPVPGATEGERFDDLASLEGLKLVTGSAGQLGFVAKWRGPTALSINAGVWLGPATNLQMIARDGHAIPEGGGVNFKNLQFRRAQLNRRGEIVFEAQTTSFPLDTGIWTGTTGGLHRIVAEGESVTAAPPLTYGNFSFTAVTRTSSDLVCFVAQLTGAPSTSDTAIVAGPLTNLQVVAREGQHAPGTTNDVVFTDLALVEPLYGEGGDIAFRATVSGPDVTVSNNTAIWAGKPGALFIVDRRSAQAKDLPAGAIHHPTLSSTFDLAGLNAQGSVVYMSLLQGTGITLDNNNALWGGRPGFESLLLQKGEGIALGNGQIGVVFSIDMVDASGQLQVGGGADGRAQSLNDRNQYLAAVGFVAGTGGSALLRIEDVTDPDANGLSRVLETAHGVAYGESAGDAAMQIRRTADGVSLSFRESAGAENTALQVERASELVNGAWAPSGVVVSNAADQSGLPPDVVRREALVPADSPSGFFRVGVQVVPPAQ